MKTLLGAAGLILVTSAAQAQQCTAELQDKFQRASVFITKVDEEHARWRASNPGRPMPKERLCPYKNQVTQFYEIAKVYFPACDSLGGNAKLPQIQRVVENMKSGC